MIELKLPEIGENIESAEVSRVLISEGDTVAVDQNVLELESEKASFPLPSTHAGQVAKIHVKVGDSVSVGQTLLEIEESQDATAAKAGKPADRTSTPTRSASEDSSTKSERVKKPAPKEKKEPASSKREPEKKTAREDLGEVEESSERSENDNAEPRPGQPGRAFVAAGPATRTLARELGVPIEQVQGHGPRGRITREDVKAFVQDHLAEEGKAQETRKDRKNAAKQDSVLLPDFSRWGPVSRQRLSPLARTTAERLSLAWRLVPHVTQHEEADITDLEAARKHYNEVNHASRPKITATALAVQAVVAVLKTSPRFNSSLDERTGELVLKSYYHIGVAVDTEQGLLVPVVRDADRKSLTAIAAEVEQLANRARERSLTREDMEGSTFTISNLGGIGGTGFTPIVNYPEVAILGISRARWQLVADGIGTEKRLLLPLSLSYDHRVINGADGARFLATVAGFLSDPFQLLAEA